MNNRMFNFIRRISFWIFDFIKGGNIRRNFKLLKYHNTLDCDSDILKKYQEIELTKLINHTINTVPKYKGLKTFSDFPILEKEFMQKDFDNYKSNKYKNRKLHKMFTSGSSGTPFMILQDKKKRKTVNAEVIYYSYLQGYRVGDKLVYLRAVNEINEVPKIRSIIENQTQIDISDFSNTNLLKSIKYIQNSYKPFILAYGSTWEELANNFADNYYPNQIVGAITGAEKISLDAIESINKMFDISLTNRYSNQENGILSQAYSNSPYLVLNETNYIIQIYDENDKLLEDGSLGKIIVTDLKNYAMPMIKYDTGDLGIIKEKNINGVKRRVLVEVHGRDTDSIYDTKGRKLSPHSINNMMWSFQTVSKFRFIQKDFGVYNLQLTTNTKKEEEKIKNSLLKLLGEDSILIFNYIEKFTLDKTGKFRYIKNEYSND